MNVADVVAGTRATVARTIQGELREGISTPFDLDREIGSVVVDSRMAQPQSLFFALKGESADGHRFVKDALERGAAGAVVTEEASLGDLPNDRLLYVVPDPLTALHRLASYWRSKHALDVVGVTGSVGKTTVKEAVAQALLPLGVDNVLKSAANLNTEIGLPLEVLKLSGHHKVAVFEMGMYQKGDISLLARIARPNIGIVTNVQNNHLERTGSIEATAQAKAELVHSLPPEGLAVLNGGDRFVRAMAYASQARCYLFGSEKGFDFAMANVLGKGRSGFDVDVFHGRKHMQIHCPTPGSHNAINLLPAIATGHHLGIPWFEMRASLNSFEMQGRGDFLPGPKGSIILDDRYNASSTSVRAALQLLREEPGRHFALLGDMYELGSSDEVEHRSVGREANDLDGLMLLGRRSEWIAEEAEKAGLAQDKIIRVRDNEQAIAAAREFLGPGDVLLIKGSRGLRLEEVVSGLRSEANLLVGDPNG